MERHEIDRAIWESMKEWIDVKQCPDCKADTTMILVHFIPNEENNELSTSPFIKKWRCMNCMNIYEEKLTKQKDLK